MIHDRDTMQPLVPTNTGLAAGPFAHTHYTIKRPFFSFFDRTFRVFGPDGSQVLKVKHPLLKLKAEWTIFADEDEKTPLVSIKQRELIALNVTSDVIDVQSGAKLGAVRNKGLKSIIRDSFEILDQNDQVIGMMQEDSNALLRRFFPFLTGKWHVEIGGGEVARIAQIFRFFIKEFTLDTSMGQGRVDPRFAMACALLALIREIHRENQG